MSSAERVVRAAGGVVWRPAGDGAVEVLLVHRPRYGDWSFPKGKNDPGEPDESCARREVEEEAGLVVELGRELPSVSYRDHRGRAKVVRYWAMTVGDDRGFVPGHEVDERAWLTVEEAARRLTYDHDRVVLEVFAAAHPTST